MENKLIKIHKNNFYGRFFLILVMISLFFFHSEIIYSSEEKSKEMTLETCIKTGISNSLNLKKAKEERLIRYYEMTEVFGNLVKLYINSGIDYYDKFGEAKEAPLLSKIDPQIEANINIKAFDGGYLIGKNNLQTLKWKIAILIEEKIKKELILQITKQFYWVLYFQEREKLLNDIFNFRERIEKEKTKIKNKGDVSKLDYNRIKLEYEQSKIDYFNGNEELAKAKNELLCLIGLEPISDLDKSNNIDCIGFLDVNIRDYNLKESIKQGLGENIDLQIAKLQRESSQIEQKITESSYFPSIDVYTTFSINWEMDQIVDKTSSEIKYTDFNSNYYVMVGIDIKIPISEWLPDSYTNIKANAETSDYEIKKLNFNNLRMEVIKEIVRNYLSLTDLFEKIQSEAEIVKIYNDNFQLAKDKFLDGNIDYISYKNVETDYKKNYLSFLGELAKFNIAKVNFLFSVGEYQ